MPRHTTRRRAAPKAPQMPAVPEGADPVTTENNLQSGPPGGGRFDKIHILYDAIDPFLKFRRMSLPSHPYNTDDLSDVSEGSDDGALTDTEAKNSDYAYHPVTVYGYVQRYVIKVSDSDPKTLFDYGEDDLCNITVWAVRWPPGTTLETKELQKPTRSNLSKKKTYKIHAGYRRVLLGFIREVDFMHEDGINMRHSLFRATYLAGILDLFAEELVGIADGAESRWRSRVLNPILQRQIRGISDHAPDMIKVVVGDTLEAAAKFYLKDDPLNPALIKQLLRCIIYLGEVRCSLRTLDSKCSLRTYIAALTATNTALSLRFHVKDEVFEASDLFSYEVAIVVNEGVTHFYKDFRLDPENAHPNPNV